MSIIRRLAAGGERRGADPRLEWGSSWIPTNGSLALGAAGVALNEDVAMSISVVHTCVAALANDVSTLPLRTYRKAKDRSRIEVDSPPVVDNPWPEGTRQDWLTQVMVSLALRGNFFGRVCDRDDVGLPLTIQPLHPDDVMCRRDQKTGKRVYRYKGSVIPLDDVFHIPALLMPGSFVGLDPISYNRYSWGLASAAEKYGGAFYANSANPSGVIEVAEDLDEGETLEMARAWAQRHQGIGLGSMPAVLTGGATWKQMSVTPENAQFLGTRDFQRVEIAGYFGIPLHRLGLQDRTTNQGTDAESAELSYVTNTLVGWLTRIESYFSLPTVTPKRVTTAFDLTGRLRGNTVARYQAWTLGANGGWLSPDDIRAKEDLPDLPGGIGGDYYRPLNFATLENIAKGAVAPTGTSGQGQVPEGSGGIGGGIDQNPDAPAGGGAAPAKLAAEVHHHYVNVTTPEVRVEVASPAVNVTTPEVRVEVPITVEQPDIRVDVAAADVTVNPLLTASVRAPAVEVHNHNQVLMPKPGPVTRSVVRDREGRITGIEET